MCFCPYSVVKFGTLNLSYKLEFRDSLIGLVLC